MPAALPYSSCMVPDEERWNRNIQYHPLLLRLGSADRVLDVGCGSGLLCRQLIPYATEVIGIDVDRSSIDEAQRETSDPAVEYIVGDVLSYPFERASFDLVVSVAVLHHMDAATGLRRFADLVKPGGTVGVVGIGRSVYPRDLGRDGIAAIATFAHRKTRRCTFWHHNSPMVWPPPLTDHEMRRLVEEVLPGARFRRHLHGRHSIVWTKPRSE